MERGYSVAAGEPHLPQIRWLAIIAKAASKNARSLERASALSWIQVTERTATASDGHRLHFISFEPDDPVFPGPGYYRPEVLRKTQITFTCKKNEPDFPDWRHLFPFPVDPGALTWRPPAPIQLHVSKMRSRSAVEFICSLPRKRSTNCPEFTANLEYVDAAVEEADWFQGRAYDAGAYLFTDTQDSAEASRIALVMPTRM